MAVLPLPATSFWEALVFCPQKKVRLTDQCFSIHFMKTLNDPMMKTGEHVWMTAKSDCEKLETLLKASCFTFKNSHIPF